MVTSVHHKCHFVVVRENTFNFRKCLGSRFLADTKLTHGKRRGWVCSDLWKAWGIIVGTEEGGKYVCLKMKNPFFITANICLWLRANWCLCSLKWRCLYWKESCCPLVLRFCNSRHHRDASPWGSRECWAGGAVTEGKYRDQNQTPWWLGKG